MICLEKNLDYNMSLKLKQQHLDFVIEGEIISLENSTVAFNQNLHIIYIPHTDTDSRENMLNIAYFLVINA